MAGNLLKFRFVFFFFFEMPNATSKSAFILKVGGLQVLKSPSVRLGVGAGGILPLDTSVSWRTFGGFVASLRGSLMIKSLQMHLQL